MHEKTSEQLIDELKRLGYVTNMRIEEALRAVPREHFVPSDLLVYAYEDEALPIGYDQTISQPLVVVFMLQQAGIRTGDTVLEIGTGSGWQTMLLSFLVSGQSSPDEQSVKKIYTIERIPELKQFAEMNASKLQDLRDSVEFVEGDGSKGFPDPAPYDRIIAAAATDEIPQAWKDQVKIGGRIVYPSGEKIVVTEKTGKNEFSSKEYFGFKFVPLIRG